MSCSACYRLAIAWRVVIYPDGHGSSGGREAHRQWSEINGKWGLKKVRIRLSIDPRKRMVATREEKEDAYMRSWPLGRIARNLCSSLG